MWKIHDHPSTHTGDPVQGFNVFASAFATSQANISVYCTGHSHAAFPLTATGYRIEKALESRQHSRSSHGLTRTYLAILASLPVFVDRKDNTPKIPPVQRSGEEPTRDTWRSLANVANLPGLLPLCIQDTFPSFQPIDGANQNLGSSAYEIRTRLPVQCQHRLSWLTWLFRLLPRHAISSAR